jgi:hypothetical protein
MHHRVLLGWSCLAVPLLVLCACSPPSRYLNTSHSNYGATEYSADLAQCRSRSVTTVVRTLEYNVLSGAGVDDVNVNACMAKQGWQEAPQSISGWYLTVQARAAGRRDHAAQSPRRPRPPKSLAGWGLVG